MPAVLAGRHADATEEGPPHRFRAGEPDPKTDHGDRLVAAHEEATGGGHPYQFDEPSGRALQVVSEQASEVSSADTCPPGQ
jgi:hypothetical protein